MPQPHYCLFTFDLMKITDFVYYLSERKVSSTRWRRKDAIEANYTFSDLESWYVLVLNLFPFVSFYEASSVSNVVGIFTGILVFLLGNCLNFISFGYAAQVK